MTEHDLQVACAQYLDACLPADAVWFHCPNGEKRDKGTAIKLKAMGVKPGIPDIFILWDCAVLCIELKAGKGKPGDDQIAMCDRLEQAGAYVLRECRSVEELETFVGRHIPLRGGVAA